MTNLPVDTPDEEFTISTTQEPMRNHKPYNPLRVVVHDDGAVGIVDVDDGDIIYLYPDQVIALLTRLVPGARFHNALIDRDKIPGIGSQAELEREQA